MPTTHAPQSIRSTSLRIGLEVHVELATRTKMFTRTPNVAHPDYFDAAPNTLVDPVVAALPGALPVMNRAAVEMAMMVGLALGCEIARFSKWDRKNYFYPDLPKGYQISQYDLPICGDGAVDIPGADGSTKRIGIIRAHLEEDTGKLGHELPGGRRYEGSLVDLNRAGTPLLEIVTAPDFGCADDVVTFAQELRHLCRFLGVTEGIMQRGHMRFEPNINVVIRTEDGREFATPIVEVKNLNSFRSLRGAIEFEARRQVEAWRQDGRTMGPGAKSTRGWDDVREVTVLQREKEDAHDYRYFPEPDLVPVVVDEELLAAVRGRLPELPIARRARYRDEFGLDPREASALVEERADAEFFEACVESLIELRGSSVPSSQGQLVAKFLLNAGAKRANERGTTLAGLLVAPRRVAELLLLREEGIVGPQAADAVFGLLCEADGDPRAIAEANGLVQVRDDASLDAWVTEAMAAHPKAVEDLRAGKSSAIGRIVGHVMKLSGGTADAKAVDAKIREKV
ncbi:MAG TPA: Asp-tRNA(Asn)/Glu-tRNA(Gln) amidotransferase subunit GatB [Phycisphaerales bacterium]|nr:Asp-tRNA(Asn)/Glu-tRNA(Gln) amidotransferase subunit GatB [Phycisphaerales bacterium]HMP36313.1 Asp-tRNA(Asn)/Glu-tRNA(Gln) amidotransferase subunit GatB [Phycisphaerales bacterium]